LQKRSLKRALMNYLELKYTIACLQLTLPGSRIRYFSQPGHQSLAMILQIKGDTRNSHTLVFDGHSPHPGLYLSDRIPRKDPGSLLTRSFNKRMAGSEILSLRMPYPDRIVILEARLPEWPAIREIWYECFGSRSNATIVDTKDGKILDCLSKFPESTPRHPLRMPGRLFENSWNRIQAEISLTSTLICSPEKWPDTTDHDTLSSILLHRWAPMTPEFSNELARVKIQSGITAAADMIQNFLRMCGQLPASSEQAAAHLKSVADTREELIGKNAYQQAKRRIEKTVSRALKRARKLKNTLMADLQNLPNPKNILERADLLAIHFHKLRQGMTEIRLQNILDPDSTEVVIELDPGKSPKANLDMWYKRAAKARRAGPLISERLKVVEREILELEHLLVKIEETEHTEQVNRLQKTLTHAGFSTGGSGVSSSRAMLSRRPYLRFVSEDGLDIWVGRNARENSLLSFKDAAPHDFWLHVKDYHGAHVIIKNPGKRREIPFRTLEYAARLAVFYSKARGEKAVPVMYTMRKHIRPAQGHIPGLVRVMRHDTIHADSPQKHR
jgi:predicted ribosome quality control (RQC) complex YloA/Tae2 family protein